MLESGPDPLDRRRTLVRTTPALNAVAERLAPLSVDDFLARELALEDQEQVPDALAALDLLARLLTPEVLADGAGTLQPARQTSSPSESLTINHPNGTGKGAHQ